MTNHSDHITSEQVGELTDKIVAASDSELWRFRGLIVGALEQMDADAKQLKTQLRNQKTMQQMVSWKDAAADALSEIGRLDQLCQRYRTALQRISRGELAVPGLKPGYYGHASAIAEVALGGVAKEKA